MCVLGRRSARPMRSREFANSTMLDQLPPRSSGLNSLCLRNREYSLDRFSIRAPPPWAWLNATIRSSISFDFTNRSLLLFGGEDN